MSECELKPDPTFFTSFQCPSCSDYLTVPIYQCDSGHSLCVTCANSSARCPCCKDQVGKKLRNYHLEHQLCAIDVDCRFAGCEGRFKLSERLVHEEQCHFNPNLPCLIQSCKWVGNRANLLVHFTTRHRIPHYEIPGDCAEYSSRLRSTTLPSSAGCVKLLHTFTYSGVQRTILTYIFMDSNKNLFYPQFRTFDDHPTKYTLKIWSTEAGSQEELTLVGHAATMQLSLEEERERKRCYVLDLESMISLFAFQDKSEEGHKLLHYKLTLS